MSTTFAGAEALLVPSTRTGTTVGAGTEAGEENIPFNDGSSTSGTVWFKFTPTYDRTVKFSTEGSTFDTILSLHTGPDFASQVAYDDDSGTGSASLLTRTLTAGVTYYICLRGFSSYEGNYQLTLSGADTTWGAWTVIDLSTAIFWTNSVGVPWGKYEGGKIVTNINWPDFSFADLVFDSTVDYEFEFTYDVPHGGTYSNSYVWLFNGYTQYNYENDQWIQGDDGTVIAGGQQDVVRIGPNFRDWRSPANWDFYVNAGALYFLFESYRYGALNQLRYRKTSLPGGTLPDYPSEPLPDPTHPVYNDGFQMSTIPADATDRASYLPGGVHS